MLQLIDSLNQHIGPKTQAIAAGVTLGSATAANKESTMNPYFAYVWSDGTYWIPCATMFGTLVSAIVIAGWLKNSAIPWTTNTAIPFFKRQLDRLKP